MRDQKRAEYDLKNEEEKKEIEQRYKYMENFKAEKIRNKNLPNSIALRKLNDDQIKPKDP